MGTDKRARQKANRQRGLAELQKQQAAQRRKRQVLRTTGAAVAAIALILVLVYAVGGKDTKSSSPTTVTALATTVDPNAPTTTTIAPVPPVCPNEDGSSPRTMAFTKAPLTCINSAKTYTALVETNQGSYTIALDAGRAPIAVNNFVFLARYHFFDSTSCHRVLAGFMAQCGDPTGTGSGGPGYTFKDELPKTIADYKAGSVAMANSGADTNGSQFFVLFNGKGLTKPGYTLFGQVTDGLDTTLKKIEALAGSPASDGIPPTQPITITKVTITQS